MSEPTFVPDTTFCIMFTREPAVRPRSTPTWEWTLYLHDPDPELNARWREFPVPLRKKHLPWPTERPELEGAGLPQDEVEHLERVAPALPKIHAEGMYERVAAALEEELIAFRVCIHGAWMHRKPTQSHPKHLQIMLLRTWYGRPEDDPVLKPTKESLKSVVNTSTKGGDHPAEYFVVQRLPEAIAGQVCEDLNGDYYGPDRYYIVTDADYELDVSAP